LVVRHSAGFKIGQRFLIEIRQTIHCHIDRGQCVPKILRMLVIFSVASILPGARSKSIGFFCPQVLHQTSIPQSEAQAKIAVNSDLVVLPVTVKDRDGQLVPDLQQHEFRVFDDKVEQSIDVFTAEAFPLSLVVLIDDDLKSVEAEQMAPSLRAIAGGISSSDEVLVSRFDLKFHPGDGFTSDPQKLAAEIKLAQEHSGPSTSPPVPWVGSPSDHPLGVGEPPVAAPTNLGHAPTKSLDDAIHAAAELLRDRTAGRRKLILLISDGENGKQFNHFTYGDALAALLQGNVSLYSLAVGSNSFHRKFTTLLNYANDTGGDIFYAAKRDALEKLYSRIMEQARHEYTLAYRPRGNNRTSNYHVVEVLTTREGLLVKSRPGYYTAQVPNQPQR
jgi:VWFA-related protein